MNAGKLARGIGMTSERTRRRLIEKLREQGITDERVLGAMTETPRHMFVDEALSSRAYENSALPIGRGQTISQPLVVAMMTQAAMAADKREKALEIGTGSGYQAAVLARLFDKVFSTERIGELARLARQRLHGLKVHNVYSRHADGLEGWPGQAPFDLAWNRDDRRGVKLYIQRVFIMDAAEQLLPRYLRFIRGVVDSADLPLNVSREILQDSPLLDKIRAAVVRRALDMIEKLADEGGEAWTTFQREFGNVLKEGVIEDPENRERIAGLLRFASTVERAPHSVSLADYLARAGEQPEAVWYLTGDSMDQLLASPHLEAFSKAGVEVLLLTDPIDVWLVNHLFEFDGKPLKSAASGEFEAPADEGEEATEAVQQQRDELCGTIKKLLGERVGNVRPSKRLTDSASCIAEEAGGMTLQMRRMLKQAGQDVPDFKPDLEINPRHPLVARLAETGDETRRTELAHLLLDQALLIDGGELADPAGFVKRVNKLLSA